MNHDFASGTPLSVTVGATSTTLAAANDGRKYLVVVNDSNETMYISLGTAAVLTVVSGSMPTVAHSKSKGSDLSVVRFMAFVPAGARTPLSLPPRP